MLIIVGVVFAIVIIVALIDSAGGIDCCIVATVCEPSLLQDFRNYRDSVLKHSIIGRLLIAFYYTFLGPSVAVMCLLSPAIKRITRSILLIIHKKLIERR